MKIRILLFLLLISMIIFNCKNKKDDKADTVFAVNTIKAVSGEINDFIELNGDVKAKIEVEVYPDTTGKLVNIRKNLGDYVYKDEAIAFIDPSKPGLDFALSPVKSTISGTITSLPIKSGSTVSMQTVIAKVGILSELEIITYISEIYISKMYKGLNAILKTQAYPDKTFKAYISELSPVVDPQTRMLEVKLKLKEYDKLLKPGMFVELKIITENKNNIVKIPSECIVKKFGNYYVFAVKRTNNDEGIAELRQIKTGIQIDNKSEIVEGLNPDEEIVIRGQSLLENNTKIKIIKTIESLSKEDNLL